MKSQNKEWYYIDEENGQQVGPISLDELDAARRGGKSRSTAMSSMPKCCAIRVP